MLYLTSIDKEYFQITGRGVIPTFWLAVYEIFLSKY